MRVQGNGNLKLSMHAQDDEFSEDLFPITMSPNTSIEPTALADMVNQRAYLRFEVTDIDEYFIINRIVVFSQTIFDTVPE